MQSGSTPLNATSALPHYPALDGLRGVAVLFVLLFHFGTAFGYGVAALPSKALNWLFCNLWTGVDLFFTLSGFLITGILLRTARQPGGIRRFFVRRTLRIFPLYFFAMFVLFVVLPRLGLPALETPSVMRVRNAQAWLWAYAEDVAITYYNDDFFDPYPFWVGHLWSLGVEEHFYLIWPFVVRAVSRRTLARLCVGLILLAPLVRVWMIARGFDSAATYTFPLSRMDELATGSLLAVLTLERDAASLRRLARRALTFGLLYVLGCMLALRSFFYWTATSSLSLGFSAIALIAASLIVFGTAAEASPFKRVLSWRPLRVVGKYSYGMYVIHTPFEPWLHVWLPPEKLAELGRPFGHTVMHLTGLVGFIALGIGLTFVLALLSYHLLELPFLALKERLGRGEAASERVAT
jgi:peptidoglycan/LPS O-acetylase OafA/YrhL